MTPGNFQQLTKFIWSITDLLRGPYRPPCRLHEIDEELEALEKRIMAQLWEVME